MIAAEQKARSTYEYLINLATDPDVIDPLTFLREREIVHFQRFGESLRLVQDYLENKKRFSMPKTFGARTIGDMNRMNAVNPMSDMNRMNAVNPMNDMPGRSFGNIKMSDDDSMPTMQMMRNVPFNESRNVPSTPAAPSLPGLPINPQVPTATPGMTMPGPTPPGMTMPGPTPPGMTMPGPTPPGMKMPGGMNMHGTMPNQTTMPGKSNSPETMNMPNMPNMHMRDMQSVPGTQTMPEMRRIQMPQDMDISPMR